MMNTQSNNDPMTKLCNIPVSITTVDDTKSTNMKIGCVKDADSFSYHNLVTSIIKEN